MKKSDFGLFRCIFKKEGKEFIKGEDYNGNRYLIKKSSATSGYREGFDDTFYAKLEIKGLFKKKILHVIKYEDYLALED